MIATAYYADADEYHGAVDRAGQEFVAYLVPLRDSVPGAMPPHSIILGGS